MVSHNILSTFTHKKHLIKTLLFSVAKVIEFCMSAHFRPEAYKKDKKHK